MATPRICIFSLFPDSVQSVLDSSILRRAQVKGQVELLAQDLREHSKDKHRSVDDTPYGGGQGMLIKLDVLEAAVSSRLKLVDGDRKRLKVVYTSPRGARLDQPLAQSLADWVGATQAEGVHELCIVCGRYEGVDERFIDRWVDLEVSVGDVILSGGDIPALLISDAIVRLLPGVLGNVESARQDSFSNGLLEYPQYTKPASYEEARVPAELLSGHHKDIGRWRMRQSLLLTAAFRPDLILKHEGVGLESWAQDLLQILKARLNGRKF